MEIEIFAGDLLWMEGAGCGDELVSTFYCSLKQARGTLYTDYLLTF